MELTELVVDAIQTYGYWALGLFLIVLAPEALMPFAGFLAHEGMVGLWWAVLAGSLGGTLGSTLIYLMVRRVGETRVRGMLQRRGRWLLMRESDLDGVLEIYGRHGNWIVAGGRLIPTVRSLVSIPAGLLPMPLARFVGLTFLGTFAWNTVLALTGYVLGAKWNLLEPYLGFYGSLVVVLVLAVVAIFVARRLGETWRDG
ncbi:DedA family protein [Ectothiorhodospira lacustris]|uniref:DedA family protein n=1 Tax=Ectothiorhodospira lacustris TaxID=2899127 RepID=UPI001EE78FEC|nr:DedA family protein [Ectothiorhodospira lacustris]MCG5500911.1 DedA family protein [Ectothiorhodospira lacustris]MCG5510590.1 DedA family protein [Ectothiorhodospira lacustris]MCG5521282.1 DedA family protein [Ectothiorhodospira lacustris]